MAGERSDVRTSRGGALMDRHRDKMDRQAFSSYSELSRPASPTQNDENSDDPPAEHIWLKLGGNCTKTTKRPIDIKGQKFHQRSASFFKKKGIKQIASELKVVAGKAK